MNNAVPVKVHTRRSQVNNNLRCNYGSDGHITIPIITSFL